MNPPEYRDVSMAVVHGRLFRVGQRPPKITLNDMWRNAIDLSNARIVAGITETHRPEWHEPEITLRVIFPGDIGDRIITIYSQRIHR